MGPGCSPVLGRFTPGVREREGGNGLKLDPEKIERVLVIGLSCMGDMILSTAALWNLRRFLPDAHFTILAGPVALPVLERDPLWDKVEEYRREKGLRGRLASVGTIRSYPHDLLVDLRSSAMPLFSGARYRPFWGLRELFLPQKMHEVERNIWCMTTLGVPVYGRRLRFFIPPQSREEACRLMASRWKDRPWVLLNPGTPGKYKTWPLENFIELGLRVVDSFCINLGVTGYYGAEREAAAKICEAIGEERCGNFSGDRHVTTLGALIERSVLFVSNDTGPLHLACAVGTPVVGLYLPKNLARFGPWGTRHSCVAAGRNGGNEPMRTIKVDEVFKSSVEMLQSVGVFAR